MKIFPRPPFIYENYDFVVMPFRLTNAPIKFMCMMNIIFSKYMDKFVLVFIDDILVYSNNKEEHEEHLRKVLQVLREHHLYAKFSKCDFYKPQIEYLGHIIFKARIAIDPENIHLGSIPDGTRITGQYLKILWLLPPRQTNHRS